MTPDEKAFIIAKQLNSGPANGLSAKHYRKKVGLELDQLTSKESLAKEIERVLGGLSEKEANRILMTNPYLQADPANLMPGRRVIDHSKGNADMLELSAKQAAQGKLANLQTPRRDRKEIIPDGRIMPDEYDGDFVKSSDLPSYDDVVSAMGGKSKREKPKRKRKPSEWNLFVAKHSTWPCVSRLGSDKLTAVSLLYKMAKDLGPESIQVFKDTDVRNFKQFKKMLKLN